MYYMLGYLPHLPVFITHCLSNIAVTEISKSILKDKGVSLLQLQNEKSLTCQDL